MEKKQVTFIRVKFQCVPLGKRKPIDQTLKIETIEGHSFINPDTMNDYERKAWQLIDAQNYRHRVVVATLQVNHGFDDGTFESIIVPSKQANALLRNGDA